MTSEQLLHLDWRRARPVLRRLAWPLVAAAVLIGLCGVAFWLIEPTTHTLADGLWLAFTTASTIGYGDLVPTTPWSRLLAVPVLLLGFGVLSLVTAAIAAMWVESQERRIEREILRDLHAQMRALRDEMRTLHDGRIALPTPSAEGERLR
jgi:voltage-gated potassium channel